MQNRIRIEPKYCSVLLVTDSEEETLNIANGLSQMGIEVGFREVYGSSHRHTWIFDFLYEEDYLVFFMKWDHLVVKTMYNNELNGA